MKTNFARISGTSLLLVFMFLVKSFEASAQRDNLRPDQQNNQSVKQQSDFTSQGNQPEVQYIQQNQQGKQRGDQHKNIQAQKIAYFTQQMNLTPDEAKAFWPVYNEYDAKRHELRKSFKETGGFQKAEYDKLTESEANKMLDSQIIEAQKYLDLRKEYHTKFKSVLPAVKVLKLYAAERDFQKMLMDKIKDHKRSTPSAGKK